MKISHFARFKGGFPEPKEDSAPEDHEETLKSAAEFLAAELSREGMACSTPEWMDYEYEIRCIVGDRQYVVALSYDFVDWEWFELSYNPTVGILARWLGRSEAADMRQLSETLDLVMRRREGLADLRWYATPMGNPAKGYSATPEIR